MGTYIEAERKRLKAESEQAKSKTANNVIVYLDFSEQWNGNKLLDFKIILKSFIGTQKVICAFYCKIVKTNKYLHIENIQILNFWFKSFYESI